jgi:hypothetical protein
MRLTGWLKAWKQSTWRGRARRLARRPAGVSRSLSPAAVVECLQSRVLLAAPNPFQLSSLPGGNGSTGFALNGGAFNDQSGRSVANAGDVNGDGLDDLLIGTPKANSNGTDAGNTYLVFGTIEGTQGSLNLAALNGTNGFILIGLSAYANTGWSVSGAGDVNGDGFADLLIGAFGPSPNGTNSGQSYLVFGGQANLNALDTAEGGTADGRLNLSALNGTTGFMLNGLAAADYSGSAVSGAGDVNGDGFADLLIGAYFADPNGNQSGQSYVVFGGLANLNALDTAAGGAADGRINLSALDGTTGFILNGLAAYDQSGFAVSGAGDVNGDGFADLLIGAFGADPNVAESGQSYLVFGGQANLNALDTAEAATADGRINLSALNGTTGFILNGLAAFDQSGRAVSGAGDVNGDGFADLLIGARYADPNGSYSGQSYLVFGGQANLAALDTAASTTADGRINLSALNGTTGFILNGLLAGDYSGAAVSGAGDVNGDGFADLLIGAYGADPNSTKSGQSYVIFGGQANLAVLDTAASTTADGRINLSALNGTTGFRLNGVAAYHRSGWSVSSAGDVNGDGFSDLLIGAWGASPNSTQSGQSYVVFGGNFTSSVTYLGTATANTLTGTSSANVMNGGRGNDTLVGNGGADVLTGGAGDDVLAISSIDFARVNGGNGNDTLRFDGSGIALDLTTLADTKLTNIETIDIRGSGANSLTLNPREVLNITQPSNGANTSNTLTVLADTNDLVSIGSGWTFAGLQGVNGVVCAVYTQGAATLRVSTVANLGPFGNGTGGMSFDGGAFNDRSGRSVANAGDVNGDGLDDLLIGAPYAEPNGFNSGSTYLVFGTIEGTQGSLNLATLNGTTGFILNGLTANDLSGWSVSGAGDVNGDGFADLLIGAIQAAPNGSNSGQSYLVFGGQANLAVLDTAGGETADGRINLSALNGTTGFMLNGLAAGDQSGFAVSGTGDVNGDGFADLLVGARWAAANGSYSGQSYVVFGGQANLEALDTSGGTTADGHIDLAALNGTTGFILNGTSPGDISGSAVSGAGDVNGDGFADLLIGARYADPNGDSSGQSYLVFGGQANLAALDTAGGTTADGRIDLSALNGTTGFILNGLTPEDQSGAAVSAAGDVNGDGFADLLVGALFADPSVPNSGQSYLVFGGQANLAALDTAGGTAADGRIELSALNGTSGFILNGVAAYDNSGVAVRSAGDVNGDGFADLLIGARWANSNGGSSGQSYVVFGGQTNLAALDTAGGATADGRFKLSALNGTTGFILNGNSAYDYSGFTVSGAGDVNGDGFADLLIGSWGADPNGSSSGQTYLVFGGNVTNSTSHLGTANSDTLTGNSSANTMNGGRGNDTLVGNGGADLLTGGAGDDVLAVSSNTFARIDGGNGSDTLRLDGSGIALDLTTLSDTKLTNIETIDIRGSGVNTLTLNLRKVLAVTEPSNGANTSNTLTVLADTNDLVSIGSGWTLATTQAGSGQRVLTYTQGAATLVVNRSYLTPTNITLSASTIDENRPAGTPVGSFSTTDLDLDDSFTYTLVSGSGSTDNGSFSIVGNVLNTAATFDFETKNSYAIRVRSTDLGGLWFEQTFTITVSDVNDTPTAIILSSTAVAEYQPAGTSVGLFNTVDPDAANTFTYALVSGGGSTDNASFAIVGNSLNTTASFNYVAKNSYALRVRSTDQGGLWVEQTFTITVTNVNETPTLLTLSATSLAENQPAGTTVGVFSTTDPDVGDTFTYTLVSGTGSTDNGNFTISGNSLNTAASFDFETKSSYAIRVRSTDAGGLWVEQTFTITVTDVQETPTLITLSATSIDENQPAGTTVGVFSTTDPDVGDTFTYTLVSGTGSTDNGSFTISGNSLNTAASFDFETKSSYAIRVRSTDSAGLWVENQFTITITDGNDVPTQISLSNIVSVLLANTSTSSAIRVADVSVTDDGLGTNTFSVSGPDASVFEVVAGQLRLKAGTVLNYATQKTYSVTVHVDDASLGNTPDASVNYTLALQGFDGTEVQNGSVGRSFVRYVSLNFGGTLGLSDAVATVGTANSRIRLFFGGTTGTQAVAKTLTAGMVSLVGNQVKLDFGANGVGGDRNSSLGDGIYRLRVDLDGDGTAEITGTFFRLFGDVDGNGVVNDTDISLVTAAQGTAGLNLATDLNGDGAVNSSDLTNVKRRKGARVTL